MLRQERFLEIVRVGATVLAIRENTSFQKLSSIMMSATSRRILDRVRSSKVGVDIMADEFLKWHFYGGAARPSWIPAERYDD